MARFLIFLFTLSLVSRALPESTDAPAREGAPPEAEAEEPPEGYYAFVESPNATPPRVRPPPYRQSSQPCPESGAPHVTAHNLCGDLNKGVIPASPLARSPHGEPYPFEVIRNATLRFLSRTLPVLRADDTLPRVAHLPPADTLHTNSIDDRNKRSVEPSSSTPEVPAPATRSSEDSPRERASEDAPRERVSDTPRESRKFCDGGGVFCMLYRAINGESSSPGVERREDPGPHAPHPAPAHQAPRYEGPPTPCPARVEYATPVFARNYQGVWRYVVQIPYEGYFTQTVEVTRCMNSRCHYLDGGCLSSPRWVSLLVAELHYPQEFQQQQLQKRAGTAAPEPAHCDGHDELGCYQVRLYYDWFLVPGSCKCWRPDYFERYVRRRHSANEL